jgi:hypothetical protein
LPLFTSCREGLLGNSESLRQEERRGLYTLAGHWDPSSLRWVDDEPLTVEESAGGHESPEDIDDIGFF